MLMYMFYFIYYTLGKPFLFQKNSNCIIFFGNKKLLSLVFELCLNIVSNVCLVPLLSIQPWTSPLPRQCSTRVPSKRQLKETLRIIQFQFQNFVIALACKFSFGILINSHTSFSTLPIKQCFIAILKDTSPKKHYILYICTKRLDTKTVQSLVLGIM